MRIKTRTFFFKIFIWASLGLHGLFPCFARFKLWNRSTETQNFRFTPYTLHERLSELTFPAICDRKCTRKITLSTFTNQTRTQILRSETASAYRTNTIRFAVVLETLQPKRAPFPVECKCSRDASARGLLASKWSSSLFWFCFWKFFTCSKFWFEPTLKTF